MDPAPGLQLDADSRTIATMDPADLQLDADSRTIATMDPAPDLQLDADSRTIATRDPAGLQLDADSRTIATMDPAGLQLDADSRTIATMDPAGLQLDADSRTIATMDPVDLQLDADSRTIATMDPADPQLDADSRTIATMDPVDLQFDADSRTIATMDPAPGLQLDADSRTIATMDPAGLQLDADSRTIATMDPAGLPLYADSRTIATIDPAGLQFDANSKTIATIDRKLLRSEATALPPHTSYVENQTPVGICNKDSDFEAGYICHNYIQKLKFTRKEKRKQKKERAYQMRQQDELYLNRIQEKQRKNDIKPEIHNKLIETKKLKMDTHEQTLRHARTKKKTQLQTDRELEEKDRKRREEQRYTWLYGHDRPTSPRECTAVLKPICEPLVANKIKHKGGHQMPSKVSAPKSHKNCDYTRREMWSASRYQEDVGKLHRHKICESKEIEERLRTEQVSIPPNMNTSPHANAPTGPDQEDWESETNESPVPFQLSVSARDFTNMTKQQLQAKHKAKQNCPHPYPLLDQLFMCQPKVMMHKLDSMSSNIRMSISSTDPGTSWESDQYSLYSMDNSENEPICTVSKDIHVGMVDDSCHTSILDNCFTNGFMAACEMSTTADDGVGTVASKDAAVDFAIVADSAAGLQLDADSSTIVTIDPVGLQLNADSRTIATMDPVGLQFDADSRTIATMDPAADIKEPNCPHPDPLIYQLFMCQPKVMMHKLDPMSNNIRMSISNTDPGTTWESNQCSLHSMENSANEPICTVSKDMHVGMVDDSCRTSMDPADLQLDANSRTIATMDPAPGLQLDATSRTIATMDPVGLQLDADSRTIATMDPAGLQLDADSRTIATMDPVDPQLDADSRTMTTMDPADLQLDADSRTIATMDPAPGLQLDADSRTIATMDPAPGLQLDADSRTIATMDPAPGLQLDADSRTIATMDPAGLQLDADSRTIATMDPADIQLDADSRTIAIMDPADLQLDADSRTIATMDPAGLQLDADSRTIATMDPAGLQLDADSRTIAIMDPAPGLQLDADSRTIAIMDPAGLQLDADSRTIAIMDPAGLQLDADSRTIATMDPAPGLQLDAESRTLATMDPAGLQLDADSRTIATMDPAGLQLDADSRTIATMDPAGLQLDADSRTIATMDPAGLQLDADSRTIATMDPAPGLQLDADSRTIATMDPAPGLQLDADSRTIATMDPAPGLQLDADSRTIAIMDPAPGLQLDADSRTIAIMDPAPGLQLDADSRTIAIMDPAPGLQLDADSRTIATMDPADIQLDADSRTIAIMDPTPGLQLDADSRTIATMDPAGLQLDADSRTIATMDPVDPQLDADSRTIATIDPVDPQLDADSRTMTTMDPAPFLQLDADSRTIATIDPASDSNVDFYPLTPASIYPAFNITVDVDSGNIASTDPVVVITVDANSGTIESTDPASNLTVQADSTPAGSINPATKLTVDADSDSGTDEEILNGGDDSSHAMDMPKFNMATTRRKIKDTKNETIFMPAILNSKMSTLGFRKKHYRVWNVVHYCPFCNYHGSNISRHLRGHKDQEEVHDLLALSSTDTKSKKLELLRMRGDHKHNVAVMKAERGSVVLARRKRDSDEFNINDYGPCPECFKWMDLTEISRHQKQTRGKVKCLAIDLLKHDYACSSTSTLKMHSMILRGDIGDNYTKASELLQEEVLNPMRRGEIKDIVVSDRLIIRLGEEWFAKCSRNPLRRGSYTSSRMKRIAKLLLECRKIKPEMSTMEEFLTPQQIDTIISACKILSGCEGHFTMKTPSVARRLKEDLVHLSETKELFGIIEQNDTTKKEAKEFKKVLSKEWPIRLGRTANSVAEENNFNKEQNLPDPSDMKKLTTYIRTSLASCVLDAKNPTWRSYAEACTLLETRLATYNKRRPGEIESLL